MILDTSAIVAVLIDEPMRHPILDRIMGADGCEVGAPSLLEAGVLLESKGRAGARTLLRTFLIDLEIDVIPFGEHHWTEAIGAFERFGRGRHPAGLNFGDCLTYATAFLAREPLLCVGDDFSKTDLEVVDLSA